MHIDGGLEVARVVKNMPSLKVLDLNGEYFIALIFRFKEEMCL